MPKKTSKQSPKYCRQKRKGRPDDAYVLLDGKRIRTSHEAIHRFMQALADRYAERHQTSPKGNTSPPSALHRTHQVEQVRDVLRDAGILKD